MSTVTIYGPTNAAQTKSFLANANFPFRRVKITMALSADQQVARENDDLSVYRVESNLLGQFPVLGFVRCLGPATEVEFVHTNPLPLLRGNFDLRIYDNTGALLSDATYFIGVTIVFYPEI